MNECCRKAIEEDREIWDEQHAVDLRIQRAEVWKEAAKMLDAEASRYSEKAKGHPQVTALLQAKWEALKRAKRTIRARAAEVRKDAPATLHSAGVNEKPEAGCIHATNWFDRTVSKCSAHCDGRMHTVCRDCGKTVDGCGAEAGKQ